MKILTNSDFTLMVNKKALELVFRSSRVFVSYTELFYWRVL